MERAELARHLNVSANSADADCFISEADPARFVAVFKQAISSRGNVFLCDPANRPAIHNSKSEIDSKSQLGWLMIPSGGTSGRLKFARHDQETIAAAVDGFCRHFDVSRVNAVGVLPLHHVSGLMAWMRCALTGGEFLSWSWKAMETGERPSLPKGDWFLSLVPTQLQRLLTQPKAVEWLRRFNAVALGGGPAWPELLERAAEARLPLALSYGLTETAAMVAALRPEEFLSGLRSAGAPLPHARIVVECEGVLQISGGSIFRGYFPEWSDNREFITDDLGFVDERGHIHVTGRRDDVIITGGKKVSATEVEAALRETGEFNDLAVIGLPDAEWGRMVVAVYPISSHEPDLERVKKNLAKRLAPHAVPKRFEAVATWPRNAQGKLNRAVLIERFSAGAKPRG